MNVKNREKEKIYAYYCLLFVTKALRRSRGRRDSIAAENLSCVCRLGLLIEGREKVCVAATAFNNIKRAIVINNAYFQLN